MSGYVRVNRLSLVQLHAEERKQRAHLKKIAEMQRRGGINNSKPAFFPHVKNNFTQQQKLKNTEIAKENVAKSKKLIDIMQPRGYNPLSAPAPPGGSSSRSSAVNLSQDNFNSPGRTSRVKGIYDVHEWKKEYEEHKEHLKISRNNKLFTPRDIGVNRQRIKQIPPSVVSSRRPTFTSTTNDAFYVLNLKKVN